MSTAGRARRSVPPLRRPASAQPSGSDTEGPDIRILARQVRGLSPEALDEAVALGLDAQPDPRRWALLLDERTRRRPAAHSLREDLGLVREGLGTMGEWLRVAGPAGGRRVQRALVAGLWGTLAGAVVSPVLLVLLMGKVSLKAALFDRPTPDFSDVGANFLFCAVLALVIGACAALRQGLASEDDD